MTGEDFRQWRDRGDALRDQGLAREAADAYGAALSIDPNDAATQFYLGLMLRDTFQLHEAAAAFRNAARLEPRSAEAFSNLGLTLQELNRPDEAIGACRSALTLNPNVGAAWCNLGLSLQTLGQIEQAIECLRNAVRLNPGEAAWHSNLLYALNFRPASREAVYAEHRTWAERHADPLSASVPPVARNRDRQRRLRVGYVSAHFRHHSVNAFVEPLLAAHDHQRLEVFAYCDVPRPQQDAVTDRLRHHADTWRETAGSNDQQLADTVRSDNIDILVDLAGHIGGNRLLVFARRPAPILVTYLGYQNTTGMSAMDYRLTDDWSDPAGTSETFYTETLVRLPETFFCYQPHVQTLEVGAPPVAAKGYITFGSFNNFAKVSVDTLDSWARILAAVEESRLILLVTAPGWLREQVHNVMGRHGVATDRVEFADQRPTEQFFELIRQCDIALDSFPFNGHTTTCDVLWMGVPVVMLAGDRYAFRFGGTALRHVGLAELIASSKDEYIARAVELARDVDRLTHLRRSLRQTMQASPIMDAARFARHLEDVYRQMWTKYCAQVEG